MQGEASVVGVVVVADGGAVLSVDGVEVIDGVLDVEDGLGFVDAGGAGSRLAVAVLGDVDELGRVGGEHGDVLGVGGAEPAVAVAGVGSGFASGSVPFVVGGGGWFGGHGYLRFYCNRVDGFGSFVKVEGSGVVRSRAGVGVRVSSVSACVSFCWLVPQPPAGCG